MGELCWDLGFDWDAVQRTGGTYPAAMGLFDNSAGSPARASIRFRCPQSSQMIINLYDLTDWSALGIITPPLQTDYDITNLAVNFSKSIHGQTATSPIAITISNPPIIASDTQLSQVFNATLPCWKVGAGNTKYPLVNVGRFEISISLVVEISNIGSLSGTKTFTRDPEMVVSPTNPVVKV